MRHDNRRQHPIPRPAAITSHRHGRWLVTPPRFPAILPPGYDRGMDGTTRLSVLAAFILFVWGVGRVPQGTARHVINRMSAIGALAAIGMAIGCFIIEASGYSLPFEGGVSGSLGWFIVFGLIYRRTKPEPVNPPAPDPGDTSELN